MNHKIDEIDETLLNFHKCDIFTPDNISQIMANYLLNEGNLLEPAVGEGNLLKFINKESYEYIDIFDIKNKYLIKCPNDNNINKFNEDFIKSNIIKKYKNIILNPPFIKIQDLSNDYIKYIKKKWNIFKKGNIDLYYVFLIKCIELLDNDGIMIAITPNSYLYNISAIQLRKFLIDNTLIDKIIDYKSEKIFDNVSTYCCITIITKKRKQTFLYNNNIIEYNKIINSEYNIFNSSNENINISKTLNDICNIKNGIATLRDKIYIHNNKLFNENCWKEITNSKQNKFIIFPYDNNGNIIDEDIFKNNNPKTYKYLLNNKIELNKRDNGNKIYPKWYSFGRTQSLKISQNENVLYIPTFLDPNNIIINKDKSKLFYSCLCIEAKDNYSLDNIIEIIKNNKLFITNNSSKRGGGWISLSGRILKQIPI
jgi:Eco57I restriction-modification methylase